MPFTVNFSIFEPGKQAPCFRTSDARLAKVEFDDMKNKMPLARMTYTIQTKDLTKQEEYVWLVYQVRKAIHRFFNGGRKKEDLNASIALEKQLDDWNTRTRFYLNTHPKCQVDEKAKAFFILVEAWREKWHKYFAYKKQTNADPAVVMQMKKECLDYEKQIDKYVKQVIGLI